MTTLRLEIRFGRRFEPLALGMPPTGENEMNERNTVIIIIIFKSAPMKRSLNIFLSRFDSK